jgi:hypothetical protein
MQPTFPTKIYFLFRKLKKYIFTQNFIDCRININMYLIAIFGLGENHVP